MSTLGSKRSKRRSPRSRVSARSARELFLLTRHDTHPRPRSERTHDSTESKDERVVSNASAANRIRRRDQRSSHTPTRRIPWVSNRVHTEVPAPLSTEDRTEVDGKRISRQRRLPQRNEPVQPPRPHSRRVRQLPDRGREGRPCRSPEGTEAVTWQPPVSSTHSRTRTPTSRR